MTLKRTLRPGRINGYRVPGGIAGYLLIGLIWTFAYQLLVQQEPSAKYFEPEIAETLPQQPSHLIYFSFVTLTTVGFGDIPDPRVLGQCSAVPLAPDRTRARLGRLADVCRRVAGGHRGSLHRLSTDIGAGADRSSGRLLDLRSPGYSCGPEPVSKP